MVFYRQEDRNCHSLQKALPAALRIKSISFPWPTGASMVLALPTPELT